MSSQLTELIFSDAVYVEVGLLFYVYGAYLGIVLDSKMYKGCHRNYNATNPTKKVLRILISILLIVPLYVCPLYLISSSRYVVLILLVKFGIPSFISGYCLFAYSKLIYNKFGLIHEEELRHGDMSYNSEFIDNDESVQIKFAKKKTMNDEEEDSEEDEDNTNKLNQF